MTSTRGAMRDGLLMTKSSTSKWPGNFVPEASLILTPEDGDTRKRVGLAVGAWRTYVTSIYWSAAMLAVGRRVLLRARLQSGPNTRRRMEQESSSGRQGAVSGQHHWFDRRNETRVGGTGLMSVRPSVATGFRPCCGPTVTAGGRETCRLGDQSSRALIRPASIGRWKKNPCAYSQPSSRSASTC
jgi:hypothetical protein